MTNLYCIQHFSRLCVYVCVGGKEAGGGGRGGRGEGGGEGGGERGEGGEGGTLCL